LVVLDDLHRADEPSLVLLGHVARDLHDSRTLVVATQRDVGHGASAARQTLLAGLVREPGTEVLVVPGLDPDSVGELLHASGVDAPPTLARDVWQRTHGNAFLVCELARASASLDDPALVPGPVADVTRHRLASLSADAQDVLRAAAVLGPEFSVGVVAAMRDEPVLELLGPIDEATTAGFVVASARPGDYRFTHDLVRSAIEIQSSTPDRIRLHAAAADAIEQLYEGRLQPQLARLARHRRLSSLPGDREPAVQAAAAAAAVAHEELAFEEAARLYRSALEVGGDELDDRTRVELLLGLAAADQAAGNIGAYQASLLEAAGLPGVRSDAQLLAEVAVATEASGGQEWERAMRAMCEKVVDGLPEDDPRAIRALAKQAQAEAYLVDEVAADRDSALALARARDRGDPAALVDALRARQLARSGPEGVDERAVLAAELRDLGRRTAGPDVERWGVLWQLDTLFERGEVSSARSAVQALEALSSSAPGPVARWHLLASQATLLQTIGEYQDAIALVREAFELLFPLGHRSAYGAFAAASTTIGRHIGHDRTDSLTICDGPPGLELPPSDPTVTVFPQLAAAHVHAELGDLERARSIVGSLPPPGTWHVVPPLRIPLWSLATLAAAPIGDRDIAAAAFEALEPFADRWSCGSAGQANNLGPVELLLGQAAATLGDAPGAQERLRRAIDTADAAGAPGYAVEGRVVLAELLRDKGDDDVARQLAREAAPVAARLGMAPYVARVDALVGTGAGLAADTTASAPPSPLSPREDEVAALVARGLTNRQIAHELYLSERTAQNHVQHILTKLGFTNRSQIAAWHSSRDATQGRVGDRPR
ncbi:MAG TPA: LuxR C-terminal-related transcriptional regulator, partial [Acidimicrobiales bacterium]|nr:LuxR C-terminal-related transcriptional regulator [Acidimicrobiales bacterium]